MQTLQIFNSINKPYLSEMCDISQVVFVMEVLAPHIAFSVQYDAEVLNRCSLTFVIVKVM